MDLDFKLQLSNIDNILKSNSNTVDIFPHLKSLLTFITDEPLKKNILGLFYSIIFNEKEKENNYKNWYVSTLMQQIKSKVFTDKEQNKNTDHYIDIVAIIEINYLVLYYISRTINSLVEKDNDFFLYTNKTDEITITKDLYSLIRINEYFTKYLEPFLSYMADFNNLTRNKEYFFNFNQVDLEISKLIDQKLVINKVEYILDIIFVCLKYIFSPNVELIKTVLHVNLESFYKNVKTLFNVTFDYLLIYLAAYEKTIKEKLTNLNYFENYLMLNQMVTSYIFDAKFIHSNSSLKDFSTYFPSFNEIFVDFFYKNLTQKFIFKINDLINFSKRIDELKLEDLNKIYFPPYLMRICKDGLADFLVYNFNAINLNENNYEVETKCSWIKPVIQCFCFAYFLDKFYENILAVLSDNDPSKEVALLNRLGNLVKSIIENKMKIVLPRRLLILKDLHLLTNLVIANYLFAKMPHLVTTLTFDQKLIDCLNKLRTYQNKFFMILGCSLLKQLLADNYKHKLRIYGYYTFPLDYYEVEQELKHSQTYQENNFYDKTPIIKISSTSSESIKSHDKMIVDDGAIEMDNIPFHNNENKFNIFNLPASNSGTPFSSIFNATSISSSAKNSSTKKKFQKSTAIKFNITQLMKNMEISQFKRLESFSNKKISLVNSKNGEIYLNLSLKHMPAAFVLIQKDSVLESFNDLNLFNYSQEISFWKDFMCCDMLNKTDVECLTGIEINSDMKNFCKFNENISNTLVNITNTFMYYDINDTLTNDEIVENLISLIN